MIGCRSCCIYLVRHGRTQWNVEGKLQGHADEPLDDEGKKQASELKDRLKEIVFAKAFSSDLSRASTTAAIVLEDRKIEVEKTPALRERFCGIWEGRLINELKEWFKGQNIPIDALSKEEYLSYESSGIESYSKTYNRLNQLIQEKAPSHLGSTILMSTHGGVLRSVLYELDFCAGLQWQVLNCAYLKLEVDEAGKIAIIDRQGVHQTSDAVIPF